ncbi:hypothetical protein [Virgibacillus kimchii]
MKGEMNKMGVCNIDHSHESVVKKLKDQEAFLPAELNENIYRFLEKDLCQETLNEVFHLLKKYDLASEEERKDRNNKFAAIMD